MINLYRIQLNLLIALNVLFEEKNVTRAARRLFLSQSAMSNNLQQLREIFHDKLLYREKNQMTLTSLSKELQPKLHRVLIELENLIQHNQTFDIAECNRTFTIGMSDKWASLILLKLMPILNKQAPKIKINVVPISEVYNAEPFEKLKCDMTIARSTVLPQFIERRLLLDDHIVCLLGKHHPLAKRKKITLSDYLSCQHIALHTPNQNLPSHVDQYFSETDATKGRNTVLYLPHLDTLFRLVEQSDYLIAALAKSSALLCKNKYHCVIRPLPVKISNIQYYIAWDKKAERDQAHQWLREQIISIIKKYTSLSK